MRKNRSFILAAAGLCLALASSGAAERQIFVCTAAQAPAAIKAAAADLAAQSDQVPLFAALRASGDAGAAAPKASEDLLAPKAFDTAAHNHLVVVGLASQDPLLAKVWGFDASVDEAKKQFFSQGWGYLEGDVGWVESDRNPFLHSHKVASAPEDAVTVKITGTTEAGVLAALKAFRAGMLNGIVAAGTPNRPRTTILDRDPAPDPAPFVMPAGLPSPGGQATLAGWTAPAQDEYLNVQDAAGAAPQAIWRYKYLIPRVLEEEPILRFFDGLGSRAMGSAVELVRFQSPEEAMAAGRAAAAGGKLAEKAVPGADKAWIGDWPYDKSESIRQSFGKNILAVAGPWMIVSSLPPEAVALVCQAAEGAR